MDSAILMLIQVYRELNNYITPGSCPEEMTRLRRQVSHYLVSHKNEFSSETRELVEKMIEERIRSVKY